MLITAGISALRPTWWIALLIGLQTPLWAVLSGLKSRRDAPRLAAWDAGH